MGYSQTNVGVLVSGPLPALVFNTPICAQYGMQVSGSGTANVMLELSMDGINFVGTGFSASVGNLIGGPSPQNLKPIAAIRANVTSLSGSIDVTIVAAPLNSE